RPVLAESEKVVRSPWNFRRQSPFITEPHVPINVVLSGLIRARRRIDFLVLVEEADASVAVIAGMDPGRLTNAPFGDGFARFPIGVTRGRVRSDLEDLVVALYCISYLQSLLHRMRHRLLAIDVFSGLHRINRYFAVPMVGRCN